MEPSGPFARGLSRRQFVELTSAGVLIAACSDEPRAADSDTEVADTEIADTTPIEIDTAPEVDSELPDTAPAETEVDAAPEVVVGPQPIGTFDPGAVAAADRQTFLYGVQAGDPTPDGAVLWTCAAAGADLLELVVFADGSVDASGDLYLRSPATMVDGGFCHVVVTGLAPDTRYRYAFLLRPAAGGDTTARSPIGRFRTAPDPEAERVIVFGGTSCVNEGYRPYRTLTRASEAELDFFVLGGDTTYCDGAKTLEDYREKWRRSFDTDGYRGLLGQVGTYATWDDHEVDDDWDPELTPAAQVAIAKRTYLDHMAVRLGEGVTDPIAEWKLWRSYRWGKTLEVFILDCRGERIPSTRFQSNATYISRAQMDWLKGGLRRSPCTFKVILNSVPITNMPNGYPAEKDRWEGYPNQRNEILSFIDGPPLIPGVLWLSGDFHFGCVAQVEPPGQRFSNQWEIFMGQGANLANPAWEPLRDTASDQIAFITGTDNFVRFTCDPFASPPAITAEFIDGNGTTLYTHVFENPS